MLATFIVILNETNMVTAIPRLMSDLGITADAAQWLSTAFMLTMAAVMAAADDDPDDHHELAEAGTTVSDVGRVADAPGVGCFSIVAASSAPFRGASRVPDGPPCRAQLELPRSNVLVAARAAYDSSSSSSVKFMMPMLPVTSASRDVRSYFA